MHISDRPRPDAATPGSDEAAFEAQFAADAKRRRLIALGVAVVVAVAVAAIAVPRYLALPTVAVVEAKGGPAERILAVTGRVRAQENVQVLSRVPGLVVEFLRDEGDAVTAGEVLGRVDDSRPRAALDQAKAAAQSQRRSVDQARRDLDRARALRANGTITDAALEAASLAAERGAEDLRRLDAAANEAELRLAEYTIVSPLTGRVLTRPVDAGQVVDSQTVIFEIAPTTERDVEAEVDEAYSMSLELGQSARMAFAGITTPIAGKVTYLSPRIDTSTGGRVVRLSFDAPDTALELPVGLSVDVNIIVEQRSDAVTLPRNALRGGASASYVLAVEDGVVTRKPVTLKDWPSATVLIDSGVTAGAQIITTPNAPADGTAVEAVAARGR